MVQYDPDKIKIGMNILVASSGDFVEREIEREQLKAGFAPEDARFTHIETSIGGFHSVGATWPRSLVRDIRTAFPNRELKFIYLKGDDFRKHLPGHDIPKRAKVALWAATKCNLGYGLPGVIWFKVAAWFQNRHSSASLRNRRNFLASMWTPFCSQLCDWALAEEGFDIWPHLGPGEIMPAHFSAASGPGESKRFEVVDATLEEGR